jgi:hypothetical protein
LYKFSLQAHSWLIAVVVVVFADIDGGGNDRETVHCCDGDHAIGRILVMSYSMI